MPLRTVHIAAFPALMKLVSSCLDVGDLALWGPFMFVSFAVVQRGGSRGIP